MTDHPASQSDGRGFAAFGPHSVVHDPVVSIVNPAGIHAGSWVSIGAVIVGDVTIGRNAVVAANTVVRADVPDCTVVAGDPAVIIRRHDGERWWSARQIVDAGDLA